MKLCVDLAKISIYSSVWAYCRSISMQNQGKSVCFQKISIRSRAEVSPSHKKFLDPSLTIPALWKKQERLKSNIKLRVCVVKNMCGQEYVWTDQHTDKEKHLKMKFRVYSSWLTSFVSSSMLKSLCLSLFDNFYIFLTDRQTDRPKRRLFKLLPRSLRK